jgi:peptidyl-dipeptidase A
MSCSSSDPSRRHFLKSSAVAGAGVLVSGSCTAGAIAFDTQSEADVFLAEFVRGWLPKETAASEAAWQALIDVSDEHTQAVVEKALDVDRFAGAEQVIATVRRLLTKKEELNELTVRQLEKVRLRAAESPALVPEVVTARAEAEAKQAAAQDGFVYTRDDKSYTANDLDRGLLTEHALPERLAVWELSKTIGNPLREGLLRLRVLRNRVARAMGFDDYFALQVADYGLTVPEMTRLCEGFVAELRPLYEHLHTWTKHELAKRYGVDPVKGALPAHWLPNRWGQNWPGLVEGVDMDAPFRGKPKEFITEQAERFYTSLGFPKLPASFWTKSDLYPVEPPSSRKKNSHASAWHIDLDSDVRSLMSIEPNNQWFTTAHHELGHIYYYISYSTAKVPALLREGANRAFHEGVGDLIGLAAGQRPYLKQVGLLTPEAAQADPILFLLDSALDGASIVFIPFAAGTMTHFERDFYGGQITDDGLNEAWWNYVRRFQGIVPPGTRPVDSCDAATKTHINDDAAQYYDYAIGTVLKFQLHDHICREILKQDPREANYFGNPRVGEFLRGILALGATRDWNAVLREATGSALSAKPMVEYYAPLLAWLKKQNAGRAIGWE